MKAVTSALKSRPICWRMIAGLLLSTTSSAHASLEDLRLHGAVDIIHDVQLHEGSDGSYRGDLLLRKAEELGFTFRTMIPVGSIHCALAFRGYRFTGEDYLEAGTALSVGSFYRETMFHYSEELKFDVRVLHQAEGRIFAVVCFGSPPIEEFKKEAERNWFIRFGEGPGMVSGTPVKVEEP